MEAEFEPHCSILQPSQLSLWNELISVPTRFVLCGGTAVALHLGHRNSVDFDFFASEHFDPDNLYDSISFLAGSRVIQKSASTLSCLVDRGSLVKISFFGVPRIQLLRSPCVAHDNKLNIASLLDLAGMKAAVVQKRAEAKDYIDIDSIIHLGGIGLAQALAAGNAIYGSAFNPLLTLKALSYFGDGNLDSLSHDVKDRLTTAVTAIDLDHLPEFYPDPRQRDRRE